MRHLPLFCALWLFALSCLATNDKNLRLYQQNLPEGSHLALLIEPLTVNGTLTTTLPIFNLNSEQLSLPASTQKVLTALAALLYLGADYRFTTSFSSPATRENNQLKGDLFLNFVGDPTLTHQQLANMLMQLRQQGIHTIDGNIIVNTSIFASHDRATGWPWNDLTQCFSAPPAATIIDKNCFSANLSTQGRVGQLARVYVPPQYPVKVSSQVVITDPQTNNNTLKYCELDAVAINNQYQLTGCLAKQSMTLPLDFAVQNPQQYAIAWLQKLLREQGIQLQGNIELTTSSKQQGRVLVSHVSAPLADLLHQMLKKSDNLIAESIFRTLGHRYYQVPGTWRAGADALRDILLTRAHIDLKNAVIVDGSGLSHQNLLSPTIMMQVLQYIAQHDNQLHLISMLPIAGKDGTLKYRHSLIKAGMTDKMEAKTGSLHGVYNLAGYFTTRSGKRYAFVQYVANYAISADVQMHNEIAPIEAFETALYRYLENQ